MSAKVPAWKRLGLKLKSGPEIGGPAAEGSKPNGHQQHHDARNANGAADAASAAAKRKRPEHSSVPPASSSPLKRTRIDDHHHAAATPPTLRKQKSVTFTDDTKNPAAAAESTKQKKNKSKKPAKPATQQPQADIKPSLEYLRAWKHARATWKFNKNYQSILMKRVFHTEAIPSADIDTFYEYIQDLKGYTRTRLRETADEVRKEDAAQGKAAFPEGTPDADSKQSEYEKVLAGLKQLGAEDGGSSGKRKRFDESGFVAQSSDVAITQRVIKRMRAETILEELAESEDSDAMTIDTEEAPAKAAAAATQEETVDKRVKLNDGTTQSASRRRKQRTANVDSSSDESSDDDSDDDSSSDSDSSDDDSDNESEVQRQAAQRDAEETSSSSSSSSEEEDDDSSDDDSSEEEEVTTKKKKSAGKR
ncbi:proteasome subunit alpha type 6 [Colletotrichum asianum]